MMRDSIRRVLEEKLDIIGPISQGLDSLNYEQRLTVETLIIFLRAYLSKTS